MFADADFDAAGFEVLGNDLAQDDEDLISGDGLGFQAQTSSPASAELGSAKTPQSRRKPSSSGWEAERSPIPIS